MAYTGHAMQFSSFLVALIALLPLALGVRAWLIAENRFLRHQIQLLQACGRRPRRPASFTRLVMALASRLFDWRPALFVVLPRTLIRWQQQAFRQYWRAKSKLPPGLPPIPKKMIELIRRTQRENRTWGARRIANELALKLGIQLSHRTVAKYMRPRRSGDSGPTWRDFLRNHAPAVIACDFFTVPSLSFRLLRVLVILELGRRRILHANVTEHPASSWVFQQFRDALPWEYEFRFLVHDRATIFSANLDERLESLGLEILRALYRTPLANAHCERLIGTIRRECLDHLIAINERHLLRILLDWIRHYNEARPHSSLGPEVPDPSSVKLRSEGRDGRRKIRPGFRVFGKPVLGGLHHEYGLAAA